jgi:hypothetical protein
MRSYFVINNGMYEHEKVSSPSIKSFEEGISSGISDPLGDGEFNSFNTPM